ncbi:MAG TPA: hypothetical protein VMU79_00480 [Casimicrobiaceae bacterium]|jgi:hypothetical protein|nr:hypothetical protein [Casimicrobiaceae bacterium]
MHGRPITLTVAAALAASISFTTLAQAPAATGGAMKATGPGKGAMASTVEITATVEAIDKAKRAVTLKGPEGNVRTVTVGPEVKNFDQIKVGDLVAVRYLEALSLELKKGGTAPVARTESAMAGKAKAGEKPGIGGARQITVTADVIAVDAAKQIVTLKGPERTVDVKVHDPDQFKLVKVGDQVEATYTEALLISVEPKAAKK